MKNKRLIIASIATLSLLLSAPAVMAKSELQNHQQQQTKEQHHHKQNMQEGTVNINTADAKVLAKLKHIGKKKAEAIVAYRTQNGAFSSVDELHKVKGISEKIIEANKSHLSLT